MKPVPPEMAQSRTPSSTPPCAAAAGRIERAMTAAVDKSKVLIMVLSQVRPFVAGSPQDERSFRNHDPVATPHSVVSISAGPCAGKPLDGRLVVGIERLCPGVGLGGARLVAAPLVDCRLIGPALGDVTV